MSFFSLTSLTGIKKLGKVPFDEAVGEKGLFIHYRTTGILTWRIPWTEEPGGLFISFMNV